MARPQVTKEATKWPGIRKITRRYEDGRTDVKYEVRVSDAAGVTKGAGTYPTLTDARAVLDDERRALRSGTFVAASAGQRRLGDVMAEWQTTQQFLDRKEGTRRTDAALLRSRLQDLADVWLDRLDEGEVRRWYERLDVPQPATKTQPERKALSASSRRRYLWLLTAVLNYAVQRGYLAKNPAAAIRRPRVAHREVTMPEREDVQRLLAALADRGELRDELFVLTAVHTGMRAGELCGLQVGALNFAHREIAVQRAIVVGSDGVLKADTPKSGRLRVIHDVSPALMTRLREHTSNLRPTDYVFGRGSQPLRYGNWDGRVFDVLRRELGLGHVRFHDLRHFHASVLIESGLSPVAVAARLGHASPTITMDVYAHQFARRDGDERASRALDAALGAP